MGDLAVEPRQLYQTLVLERSVQRAGLAPKMLRQIFEEHSCVAACGGPAPSWTSSEPRGSEPSELEVRKRRKGKGRGKKGVQCAQEKI